MADLEANMMHFQLMHESLSRFSESFASFLYGLNMNAFCVDFPEGPVAESFRRDRQHVDLQGKQYHLAIKNTQESQKLTKRKQLTPSQKGPDEATMMEKQRSC